MQLSIIIVNYNVKYFLEQCLYSVQKACTGIRAEIFVVDNHSTDGSKDYLFQKFPQVNFKWNISNDGFGKASNSVLKEAKGEYILFLNPDTIVPEDCFEKCLAFFETHKNAGALGVKMLDGTGAFLQESKRGFPTPLTSFYKMSGMAAVFSTSKIFARYYAGHLSQEEINEVDVLSGAFIMLSKKAIEYTNGFDENFFMYGEDVDLSFRIKKTGLSNYYFPQTTIIHFKGESTQKMSKNYLKHFYGAMIMFVNKHYHQKKATIFLMYVAISISKVIASLRTIVPNKEKDNTYPVKALNTAIVGGLQKFNECINVVKYAASPLLLVGRISAQSKDKESSIGVFSNLESCIKEYKIVQVIFCEGEISNKEIIQKVEENSGNSNFLFHANGSNSIVGSNDKNTNGIFIVKPSVF